MVASLEKISSAQEMVQLYLPLPHSPASTGHPVQFSKVTLRQEAEPNFRKMVYAEVLETEPGKVVMGSPAKPQVPEQQVKSLLCWKDGRWEGHHRHHHLHAAELGIWHGAILLLIWKSVNIHPRHSWGLFLPAAYTEGNASVVSQARMGHFTCTHRCKASQASQVFHSNTGQRVHLFHESSRLFPN